MALHGLTDDGYLTWRCEMYNRDGELVSCGQMRTAHIDEMVYQDCPMIDEPGKGAVIMLPQCSCGVRTDIKADYTLDELVKGLELVADEHTDQRAYVLPLRYVLNIKTHWMLYQSGKAAIAPVLEMPPQAVLEHSSFACIQPGTVYALWFGFSIAKHYEQHKIEPSKVYLIGVKQ